MPNRTRKLDLSSPSLQDQAWPPVNPFDGFTSHFGRFLKMPRREQLKQLEEFRCDREVHGSFINHGLGVVNAYQYGYHDSPLFLKTDDRTEFRLQRCKLLLERELMDHWLPHKPAVQITDQRQAADHLRGLSADNHAVEHPLYKWLETAANRVAMTTFLDDEVIRNEVVDDEVAKLVCGHQGTLKSMAGVNLADELGRGKLEHAHTYWLRVYLDETDGWVRLRKYRRTERPWFTNIMSNVFNMTLTRPGLKFVAYGHFLLTEALVCPHFERLIAGMRRLGLCQGDASLYFTAHAKLDPYHAEELIDGLANQRPELGPDEVQQIILGAEWTVAGAQEQYGRVFQHLTIATAEMKSVA